MLINENRLSMADPRARTYLAQQVEAYFFGSGADSASGVRPSQALSSKNRIRRSGFPVANHRIRGREAAPTHHSLYR